MQHRSSVLLRSLQRGITQHQATLWILGLLIAGDLAVFLAAWLIPPGDPGLALVAAVMLLVLLGLLVSYLRGWQYAWQATVIAVTLALAFGIQEPYLTNGDISLLIAPLIAQLLAGPSWVLASAATVWGVLWVRAGSDGIYSNPVALALWVILVGGLIVSRLIMETSLREAKASRREAESQANLARRSEAQYRLLFESHPEPMWVYDLNNLQFLAVNDAAVAHYGYARDEFLAMTIKDIRPPEDVPRLLASVDPALDGIDHAGRWRHRTKDGRLIDVEIVSHALTFAGRRADLVMATDVTERLRANNQLRVQGAALQAAANGIAITDRAGVMEWVNPGFVLLTGYAPEEAIGETMRLLRSGQQPPEVYRDLWTTIQSGQVWQGLLVNRRKDGSLYTEEQIITPVRDDTGTITHYVAIKQDVTEREQARAALAASEKRFRSLIENSSDAITLIAADGTVVYDSPSAPGMLGYRADEWIGRNALKLLHPDDLAPSQRLLGELLKQPGARECARFRLRHKDGSWRWIEAVASNLLDEPAVRAIVINYRDVTERMRAEQALHEVLLRNESILASVADTHLLFDRQWRYQYANPAAVHAIGRPLEQILGHTLWELFPDIVGTELDREYRRAMDECVAVDFDFHYLATDTWWHNRFFPASEGLAVFASNITERKRAEAAVAASEAELRALFAAMTDVVLVLDAHGRYIQIAPTNPALLVRPPQELVGKTIHEVLPAAEADNVQRHLDRALAASEPVHIEYSLTLDGATAWFDATISPFGEGQVIWIARDITARIQRERELEAIVTVGTALRTARGQAQMLPIVLEQVTALLDTAASELVLRDPNTDELIIALGQGEMAAVTGQRLPPGAGIGGHVLATGQPYVTSDVTTDPNFVQRGVIVQARAAACVPLMTHQQAMGVLWAGRATPFSDVEVRVLAAIADIAASALQRATLHEQTEQRLQRLVALRSIDTAIMNSLDLQMTLGILLDQVKSQLGVDAADIHLLGRGVQILEYSAGRGFRTRNIEHSRLRLGEGHAGQAALERRLVTIRDLQSDPNTFRRALLLGEEAFVSMVCAPLVAKGQLVGILEVFHRTILQPDADWLAFFETLAGQAAIAVADARLFADLQRSNTDLLLAYDTTLEGWSAALDLRDRETEGHSQRVTEMTVRLARVLDVSEQELEHIRRGALLHDIGKMGIPDVILHKPGKLTDEEWVIMRQHPGLAYQMLSPIAFLRPALDIPYCHHEKWDGTGYPRQLKGEAIPLAARIFAVVDVWDALRSDRPYRSGWPEARVRDYIREQAGQHFDPKIVDAFLALDV